MTNTMLYVTLDDGTRIEAGKIVVDTYTLVCTSNTFMRKYQCPRGIRQRVIDYLQQHNVEKIKLILPSCTYTTTVHTLTDPSLSTYALERNEAQWFLPVSAWERGPSEYGTRQKDSTEIPLDI